MNGATSLIAALVRIGGTAGRPALIAGPTGRGLLERSALWSFWLALLPVSVLVVRRSGRAGTPRRR